MSVSNEELQRRVKQLEADVRALKTGRTFNIESGTTQPSTVDAGVLWVDTDDDSNVKMGV